MDVTENDILIVGSDGQIIDGKHKIFGEIFKEIYTDNTLTESMRYLFFGINGHAMLKPYIWSSMFMSILAMVIIFRLKDKEHSGLYVFACILTILGIWIEKGMGLVIPGFIPTPLGDLVEYAPLLSEFFICLGIYSFGALLFTMISKVTIAIQVGDLRERPSIAKK